MKKYIIYTGILIAGLLLGYLFFAERGESEKHDHTSSEETVQMWTCSMHPQIMRPEPGSCPICGMDLIPADATTEGLEPNQFKMTENALALANIQTTVIGSGMGEGGSIRLSGKVVENEEASVTQTAHFGGRIEKLYVNSTGASVNRGQLLALVYSPELLAAQQELLTAASLKENQPQLYNAVRNKLKLWKLSDKQIQEIEASGKVKENFPVYANVTGIVTEKLVEEGNYVDQGQPLYKIADLSTVWGEFDAYENQISLLQKGQPVTVHTSAYPNKEFQAKISFIDPILNTARRVVTVRVVLNNKDNLFKPGMFLEGVIEGTAKSGSDNVITVPRSAVLWTGKRSLVYVKPDPSQPVFEMREVTLGDASGDNYVILDGLQAGEEIVTNGTFTVDAAAQLRGKKSMMSPEGRPGGASAHAIHGMKMDDNSRVNEKQISTEKFLEDKAYDFRDSTPKAFRQQLDAVIHAYLSLKEGLVEANDEVTARYSSELLEALQNVNDDLLKGVAKTFWEEKKEFLFKHAQLGKEATTISGKRENFVYLSQPLIKIVEAYHPGDIKLYVNYCPMANNNKGAYWLSAKENIRNPYFGDAMLTCGEVVKTIEQ